MKQPDRKELRRFGLVMAGALSFIAGLVYWRSGDFSYLIQGLAAGAGLLAISGLAFPILLLPFERAWSGLARVLGWLNLRILLTLAYILIFVPLGLVFKLIGKDTLQRKINRNVDTYWKDRPVTDPDPGSYERQH
ncbi:MAG: hypothetical protein GXP49_13720 [Deltaproteobacteria bacterium]|nr:hypothetical protein [Deltaproteobacteria bacterium]